MSMPIIAIVKNAVVKLIGKIRPSVIARALLSEAVPLAEEYAEAVVKAKLLLAGVAVDDAAVKGIVEAVVNAIDEKL